MLGVFFLKIYSVRTLWTGVMMVVYFSFIWGHCCDTEPPQSINISLIALLKLQCLRFDGIEWDVAAFTDYF